MIFKKLANKPSDIIVAIISKDDEAQIAHGYNFLSPHLRIKTFKYKKLESRNVDLAEARKHFEQLTQKQFYQNLVETTDPESANQTTKIHSYIKHALDL